MIAGLAAGCGAAGSDPKTEFIAAAGEICKRSKAAADRDAAKALEGRPATEHVQVVLRAALPHIRASGAAIDRLDPPPDDADVIARYLREYERATVELAEIAADPERRAGLMSGAITDPFRKADRLAGEYGIRACSGDDA